MFFPKLILPLSKVIIVGVEFTVSLVMLFIFMIWEQINPGFKNFQPSDLYLTQCSSRPFDSDMGQRHHHSLSRYQSTLAYHHRYWYLGLRLFSFRLPSSRRNIIFLCISILCLVSSKGIDSLYFASHFRS
jgi:hypothetical protein